VTTAAVFGLLAFGLAVRLRQYFGCPSFWYDEAYFVVNILHRSWDQLLGPIDDSVVAPPAFLWLLRGIYLVAGSSEWAMRLPALLAGAASLLFVIPLAYRVVACPGWWLIVGFTAVSKHALMHTNEVRPYSCDFLVTVVVLLSAWAVLEKEHHGGGFRVAATSLLSLAFLAPWLSFPSAFVLGGVSVAILNEALVSRTRRMWILWMLFTGLFVASSLGVWYFDARHLYYPEMRTAWGASGWRGFPAGHSAVEVIAWTARCLVGIGHYGLDGMGLPLLVFAGLGVWLSWRRSPSLAILMTAPIALAVAAAMLRYYPLTDRTVFFCVPCLWLLAAIGVGTTVVALRARVRWAGILLMTALIAPSAVATARSFITVEPKADFRDAFEYVQQHRLPDDKLWLTFPQVYEIYYGRQPGVLGSYDSAAKAAAAACRARIWLVVSPGLCGGRTEEVLGLLRAIPCRITDAYQAKGVFVMLSEPPAPSATQVTGLSSPR
jgi:hypothetical protein